MNLFVDVLSDTPSNLTSVNVIFVKREKNNRIFDLDFICSRSLNH